MNIELPDFENIKSYMGQLSEESLNEAIDDYFNVDRIRVAITNNTKRIIDLKIKRLYWQKKIDRLMNYHRAIDEDLAESCYNEDITRTVAHHKIVDALKSAFKDRFKDVSTDWDEHEEFIKQLNKIHEEK